jgi:polyisoprenoid-binding protein YceI
MKRLATLIALAVVAGSAQAAPETYIIDSSHTFPQFSYTHLGFSRQTQKFDKTTGQVVLDRAAKTGSADVTIDATSVNTGYALFNQHIQGEDYFNTARYPTITFKSKKITKAGKDAFKVTGDLTIKGKTKEVVLSVSGSSVIIKRISIADMTEEELTESIKWEAEQYIPFSIDDVNVDFQKLGPGAAEGQADVLLVAVKKDKINDYVNLVKDAGLEPVIVDVDAFALANMCELNYEVEAGITAGAFTLRIGQASASLQALMPLLLKDPALGLWTP